jgi:hypothetical protein
MSFAFWRRYAPGQFAQFCHASYPCSVFAKTAYQLLEGVQKSSFAAEPAGGTTRGRLSLAGAVLAIHPVRAAAAMQTPDSFSDPRGAHSALVIPVRLRPATLHGRRAAPDLADADLFATKSDGNRPLGGILRRCMTRGHKRLVPHCLFDPHPLH